MKVARHNNSIIFKHTFKANRQWENAQTHAPDVGGHNDRVKTGWFERIHGFLGIYGIGDDGRSLDQITVTLRPNPLQKRRCLPSSAYLEA